MLFSVEGVWILLWKCVGFESLLSQAWNLEQTLCGQPLGWVFYKDDLDNAFPT